MLATGPARPVCATITRIPDSDVYSDYTTSPYQELHVCQPTSMRQSGVAGTPQVRQGGGGSPCSRWVRAPDPHRAHAGRGFRRVDARELCERPRHVKGNMSDFGVPRPNFSWGVARSWRLMGWVSRHTSASNLTSILTAGQVRRTSFWTSRWHMY